MTKKFSIATSVAVVLALAVASLVLAAQPAQVVFTADAPCAVNVLVISYTDPTNLPGQNVSGLTPWTLDTFPSTAVTFFYPAFVVCSGTTYNFVFASPSSPLTSGAENAITTVIGHYSSDTTPPIIAPHGDVTAEATSALGAIVNYVAPATSDAVDGAGIATCAPASGTQFALGDTTVKCDAVDAAGNHAVQTSFVVHVVDTTAPVIAPHGDETVPATSALGAVVNYVAPATTDAVDGAGTATCVPASGTQFALGDTTVKCDAVDAAGNHAVQTSFVVHVIDPAAPVIAPHGDETVEATSALGAIVNYVAPTTSDAVDGAGTATCVPASGTQFALGDTTVKCDAVDAAGNHAVQTSFVIHVVDTTAPVIAPHGDETVPATSALGAIVNYVAPATTDAVDGAGTATCVPASGTQFALGDTTVKCDAVDAAGNHAVQTSFVVHVVEMDTTPPTITFISRLPAANGFGWNNSDVTVTWSCSDNVGVVSPTVTQVVTSEGSALSATGTCTDTSGNTALDTQTGFNVDKTAPTLAPAVSPNPVILNGSATVNANASDGLSGLDTVNCGTLDTSSVGSKLVTCTATDKAGNSNSVSVNYSVQYATAGSNCKGIAGHQILQPINSDGSSVFQAGSTVPAKFRVCGADGDPIGTDGVVANFRLIQIISNDIVTNVDEAVLSTTPDDVFRSGNSQWIFNISTKNLNADNTYVYLITLNDGSTIQFQFALK